MFKQLEEYVRPDSLKDALAILDKKKDAAKILAGGTAVMVSHNAGVKTLVDIKHLGLNKIKKEGKDMKIGAAVTISQLLQNPLIQKYCGGLLYQSAYFIASTPLRNMITLGGNIVSVYPWSDLPVALLLSDAKVIIAGKEKTRTVSYRELLKKHPAQNIAKNEIVTDIILPDAAGYSGAFVKYAKTSFDLAMLDVGVTAKIKGREFEDVRFAISAIGPLPQMLNESAGMLIGCKTNDAAAIEKAAAKASVEAKFMSDKRVSIEYKKEILPVLIRRLVEKIVEEK
ncbi:MAG TPA: FAD binding domain-containing protein [Candidatus Wallbacteria bacterium]|nr:FAD binding domain-containing protein [Candidatus Wallbacteria bacterium]